MTDTDSGNIAISIDYGMFLHDQRDRLGLIAGLMTRPCFRELERVSARRYDRWTGRTRSSIESITKILANPSNDAVAFDCRRSRDLVATAEVESGRHVIGRRGDRTRFLAHVVVPYHRAELDAVVATTCELAAAVDARGGFVAQEPTFGLAHRVALGGGFWPKPRPGLSDQRRRGRRARWRKQEMLDDWVPHLEWGTFLNEKHAARLDLEAIRRSGVFERIVSITPRLVFLQLTTDLTDDLSETLEERLRPARALLAPVLMDISDIDLVQL